MTLIATIGSVGVSRRGWVPSRLGSRLLFWGSGRRSQLAIGSLLASGTTPPAVTLARISSSIAWSLAGVRIEITTGGARGTAVFRVSINNGAGWVAQNVPTATTYDIPGTNYRLTFPVGTYAADNVYEATCSSLVDIGSAHNTPSNAGASAQPRIITSTGPANRPALRFDGVNDRLDFSTNVTNAAIGIFAVTAKISGSGTHGLCVLDKNAVYVHVSSLGGHWGTFVTPGLIDSGQAAASTPTILGLNVRAANDLDLYTNGGNKVTATSGSSFPARGTSSIGCDPSGVQFGNFDLFELIIVSGALASADVVRMHRYLGREHGIALAA